MESKRDREIRERAHELWIQGGRRSDTADADWHQAEQEYAASLKDKSAKADTGKTPPAKAGKDEKPAKAARAGNEGKPAKAEPAKKEPAVSAKAATKSETVKADAKSKADDTKADGKKAGSKGKTGSAKS
jgi:hypothetical protein